MPESFPFDRLTAMSPRDAIILKRCARSLLDIDIQTMQSRAERLLGVPLHITPGILELGSLDGLTDAGATPIVILVLEQESGGNGNRLFVDLSMQLSAVVVDRALGGDGEAMGGPCLMGLDDLSRGVIAYVAARLLADPTQQWRLSAVLSNRDDAQQMMGIDKVGIWPFSIRIGSHSGTARIWIPDLTAKGFSNKKSIILAEELLRIEITLCATAGHSILRYRELASIKSQDIVMLDHCDLYRERGYWCGMIDLMIAGARRTRWRCKADNQTLCIDSVNSSREPTMKEGHTQIQLKPEDLMKLAGDTPIDVMVELARFTLPLEELASLRVGEILTTGQPIGERVTLRVAGQAIASGELVDVDGYVGVRIL